MMGSLLRTPPPDVAVEVGPGRVSGARLLGGARPAVAACAAEPLPAGAVTPSLTAANLADVGLVAAGLRRVLDQVAPRARRVALVVPDPVARVSLVRFDTVPARAQDLAELIRWQVRKATPFGLDGAIVRYAPGLLSSDHGREFVVCVARQDVVAQYEQAAAMAGVHAGLVGLASFDIVNAVEAARDRPAGDWLLVHAASGYATVVVVREGVLLFFRSRTEDAEGSLADLVHQTAMYYEDRIRGSGFARVLLAGAASAEGAIDPTRRDLAARLGREVELVDPRGAAGLAERIGASPELLDRLAPLVGVLCRARAA